MESCLYEGRLRHRRFAPTTNAFEYRLFMVYVDLDELDTLFDGHPLWSSRGRNVATFTRADHLGDPDTDLDTAVRNLVERESGDRPDGAIRFLTHFRYFGCRFNPVSFYYCFDRNDRLETVVSEVNNTPWGEQHPYVLGESLNEGTPDLARYRFRKAFHVSPFMSMTQDYDWRFSAPGDNLAVHMENFEDGDRCFDATLLMKRREISRSELTRVLVRYPAMTAVVIGAIYWQALRLWWKRTPVHDHPAAAPAGA